MCITPLTIKRKNASVFGETTRSVPCGHCVSCLSSRSREWTFRLKQEAKVSSSVAFTTFTYNNDQVPISFNGYPTLDKDDFQGFVKRLRHKTHNKIKYYACGEYGTQFKRPHYHAIIFNLPLKWFEPGNMVVADTWQKGIIEIENDLGDAMSYVTKYITKGRWKPEDDDDDRQPEFPLMSKKLGASFLTKAMVKHCKEQLNGVVYVNGYPTPLPRYFKDKIFTEEEKIKLQVQAKEAAELTFKRKYKSDIRLLNEVIKAKILKHQKDIRSQRLKF